MKKTKISSRVIASILSLMMVISIFPLSGNVYAATQAHPDAVTITVTDENGQPIEGAAVAIVVDSVANGEAFISETKNTDETGVVDVMASDAFVADDLTISATVTAEGYADGELSAKAIESGDANFDVALKDKTIRDVRIEGKTLIYNGNAQELVSVTKLEGDTVEYYYPADAENSSNNVPVETNAGTYTVKVVVKRDGMNDLIDTVTTSIKPASIEGISIEGKNMAYDDGREQEVVTLTGSFDESDIVIWIVNGEEIVSHDIPKVFAVDTYKVSLKVERDDNHNILITEEVTSNLIEGELKLDDLTVDGLDGVYTVEDGEAVAQKVVSVKNKGNYDLQYQLDDGDLTVNDNAWVDEIPTVTDAGSYIVWVKAVKESYKDAEVTVNPAENAVAPYNVFVAKASQSLEFDAEAPSEVTLGENNEYDFAATGENLSEKDIEYSLVDATADDVATITADGKLTVKNAGIVTVKAFRPGNDNYQDAVVYKTVVVKNAGTELVTFDKDSKYILDADGVVSEKTANKANNNDNGVVSYSIDNKTIGLAIDSTNGKITVEDISKLTEAMGIAGSVSVEVTAKKTEGSLEGVEWVFDSESGWKTNNINKNVFGEDYDTYTVEITYDTTITSEDIIVAEADPVSGWYNDAEPKAYPATITPKDAEKYTIALGNIDLDAFGEAVTIEEQGIGTHYVYLKNEETKQISAAIAVDVKVDTVKPDADKIEIKYSESLKDKIYEFFTLGFYNPSVTVTLTAIDVTSGIDYFTWNYTKETGASEINHPASVIGQKVEAVQVQDAEDSTKYTAEFTITADEANQYRGYLDITATDKANNTSDVKTDAGNVFVVDTINPEMEIKFEGKDETIKQIESIYAVTETTNYYNGDIKVTLAITEANFYSENIDVIVTKDGNPYDIGELDWEPRNAQDESVTEFMLSGDGDYVVTIKAIDNSGNEMVTYISETFTVDTTAPEIKSVYNQEEQNIVVTIKEHNFRAADITVETKAWDISENVVSVNDIQAYMQDAANWTTEGDKHTLVLESTGDNKVLVDAYYNLIIGYMDISDNAIDVSEGTENVWVIENALIDHTAPTEPIIEYEKSIVDVLLENITFGFYNPSVTVSFTSFDDGAGVESFTWDYTNSEDASKINHNSFADRLITGEDVKQEKNKFTATTTLTATEAEQYRGYLSVMATDGFDNHSDKKVDNGNVIVVDTVAPEILVEYTEYDRLVGTTDYYYNKDINVEFIVTEANFYPEDVKVTVTKNGEVFDFGTVSWGSRNEDDKTSGTFTLPAPEDHSGDGHYVISVEYTDRSNNEMVKYVSDTHTIDTIAPVINVEYQNKKVINTLKDNDGKNRQYFKEVQTAEITIEEHNFNSGEVEFTIIAKDVKGKKLDEESLCTMSEWTKGDTDDIHKITLTYSGDANYTFDVAYTDKATNAAIDYEEDYFTVDKTNPKVVDVKYSTSVLDTVLESLTFGFYNAKMTVTLIASDKTSKVHSFLYSYLNAEGVSSVNAELVEKVIKAKKIKYSDYNSTATVTFEVPKMVLDKDNQFNGTVEFTATDRAGNTSKLHKETKRVVVDNIAPKAKVSYSEPINTEGKISYYNGDIDVTINVTEANFYSKDVKVKVSKDGGAFKAVKVKWKDNSVDKHTGKFTLTEDGDYIVSIEYQDKSGNKIKSYKSNQLTIDTDIKAPSLSVNGSNGGAFSKDVNVAYSFEDINFDTSNIKLTRTRFDTVEDVTSEFIGAKMTGDGGSGSFKIPETVDNDGIYTLSINIADKAKHTTSSQMTFTVNRYGSVYVYDTYLASLIKDGGQFITLKDGNKVAITEDLVINEYNACEITKDALNILITRDGEVVDADYTRTQVSGNSGWYQYAYVIDADNFKEDGVYKITLTSKYDTVDSESNESISVPENSIDKDGKEILDTMCFIVDTEAPEISNVLNLDKKVADKDKIVDGKLTVKYTIIDIGGLESIEIIVNGETLDKITKFANNLYNYSGEFTLSAGSDEQTVQFIVTDKAGNVTDTSSKDFSTNDIYVFNGELTVPSGTMDRIIANIKVFFKDWYANKPLFWGSIAGVVVVAGVAGFVIVSKKKKKED